MSIEIILSDGSRRLPLKVVTVADGASITPDVDTSDITEQVNTGSGTLTINNPSGTETDGKRLAFRIKSTNARSITWGSRYRGSATKTLPTALSGGSTTDYFAFLFNDTDTKWDFIGETTGF